MAPAVTTYEPRDPSSTILYQVIAEHLETFLASLDDDPDAKGLPAYVQREFYDYLRCGILAHGFLRLGCDACPKETLLCWLSAVNEERFVPPVRAGVWLRVRLTWSSVSSRGCRHVNG